MKAEVLTPLFLLLQRKPSFVVSLSESISAHECDFLARILLKITEQGGFRMRLIKSLIRHELVKYQHMPQNIFRSNSLASKVLGVYVREVGSSYLKLVLGELITELLATDCNLEIDPTKLKDSTDEKVRKNLESLIHWTDKILERLMDDSVRNTMPQEVKLVASYIAHISDSLQLDTPVLIGGYIMLRFFNPAIATPDAYGLVKKGKGKNGQRNLILISKIIQNLANGVLFGQKEHFMTSLNDFLEQKRPEMRDYLSSIIVESPDNIRDAEDTTKQDSENLVETIPPENEYPRLEQYPKQEVPVEEVKDFADFSDLQLSERDCEKLHKLLWDTAPSVVSFLVKNGVKNVRHCSDFMGEVIGVLRAVEEIGAIGEENVKDRLAEISKSMIDALQDHYDEIDNRDFEHKFLIYTPSTTARERTVFCILNKLSLDLWNSPSKLACLLLAICKIIFAIPANLVNIVIDCSLVWIGSQHKSIIATLYNTFKTYLPGARIKSVILLHAPGCANVASGSQSFVYNVLKNLSKKEEFKLYDLAHYEKLSEIIPPDQVLIPEESRIFVEQYYRVVKVNAKGKHQDRLIVMTPKSILNIDPRNSHVKNERLLSEIEEIIAPSANLEIHMKFRPAVTGDDPAKPFFSGKSNEDAEQESQPQDGPIDLDSIFRRYIVNTDADRGYLMEDMFETTVKSQFVNAPMAYQIYQTTLGEENSKVTHEDVLQHMAQKKKKETRILKFTNVNILEIEKRAVRSRLPYIAIESFDLITGDEVVESALDNDEKNVTRSKYVVMKLQHEGFHRIWSVKSKTLTEENVIASITEGARRVRDTVRVRKAKQLESHGKQI